MNKLRISMACCDYDRCRALFDGRAPIEGCEVSAVPIEPEEAFHRAFKFNEFDVSEISMSSHTLMTSRGQNAYVGVPAFVSRLFRHSGIYIRTDRGIKTPADLKGKTIGLPEYQITANVWIRGVLADEYGVKPEDVHWRSGGLEDPGREERAPLKLPAGIDLKPIPHDRTLSDMLEKGEIDAMISARAPSCFARGAANVDRMFPDYKSTEQEYFRRTGIFPVMHIIGIRRELAERPLLLEHLAEPDPPRRRQGGVAQPVEEPPFQVPLLRAEHERVQGLQQGERVVHVRTGPDRPPVQHAALGRGRVRGGEETDGRGLLELRF